MSADVKVIRISGKTKPRIIRNLGTFYETFILCHLSSRHLSRDACPWQVDSAFSNIGATTLSITTFSITTLSIMGLFATLSITTLA